MTRGTTPTHIFLLPDYLDSSLFTEVFITYAQLGKVVTEKEMEDLTEGTLVSEGIDANYMDIINYSVFALIKMGVGC